MAKRLVDLRILFQRLNRETSVLLRDAGDEDLLVQEGLVGIDGAANQLVERSVAKLEVPLDFGRVDHGATKGSANALGSDWDGIVADRADADRAGGRRTRRGRGLVAGGEHAQRGEQQCGPEHENLQWGDWCGGTSGDH